MANPIKVNVGSNLKRASVVVPANTTLRTVLEEQQINYGVGVTTLDGAPLGPGDLDKTFEAFGIAEKCMLLNVLKADNA